MLCLAASRQMTSFLDKSTMTDGNIYVKLGKMSGFVLFGLSHADPPNTVATLRMWIQGLKTCWGPTGPLAAQCLETDAAARRCVSDGSCKFQGIDKLKATVSKIFGIRRLADRLTEWRRVHRRFAVVV